MLLADPTARPRLVPLWVKVAYTLWLVVWLPLYWRHHGATNLLWFCDLANLIALPAIWLESRLLLSSQLVGVAVAQVGWTVDFAGRLLLGAHPIGGTEYMFEAADPLWLRGLSLFHLWMLPLLVWLVLRTGYDRRGFALQSAIAWATLPLSMALGSREQNLNWVWGPFGREQDLMAPWAWVACLAVLYPLVLFLPAHALAAWADRRRAGRLAERHPSRQLLPAP